MTIRLEGKRIVLRELEEKDAERLFLLAKEKDIARFTMVPHPYSIEMAKEFIDKTFDKIENSLTVELKETKEIIGMCSLVRINKESRNAELGYWIGKDFWRKGYAEEATRVIIRWGFEIIDLERISARVLHQNIPSKNLIEKLGFAYEGRERKAILRFDEWSDFLLYGMLKEEHKRD